MNNPNGKPIILAEVTLENFQPLIGQIFYVADQGHCEALTLEKAAPFRQANPAGKRKPFSLFFRGESKTVLLNQQIHPLRHATLGDLEIFLVPVSRYADGTHRYQAVFN